MHLKQLTLQGYKTFATRTEFLFDKGVTAIVGPNGSGKSNIGDALRWVLGEQSYKTLRGHSTTDMIYAGSNSRARAGMAQAVLTLDNSDGWLPIEFSEVEIGRRAFRSGDNEYLLNGQKVRLRDITELLATSGLAERTYTMIGQGLIDKALSIKADERRALFEEAAGISHYKSRRAETLRRLQETQRNLERVHDILSEIKPRLNSLRRQANRARNYQQVEADLRHLLRIWYGYQWAQGQERGLRLRAEAEAREQAWQDARQMVGSLQSLSSQRRQERLDLEDAIQALQNQRDDARESLATARRQVAVQQERRGLLQQQLTNLKEEAPGLQTQYEAAETALKEALADLESAQAELTDHERALAQFNNAFQAQQAAIDKWRRTRRETAAAQRQRQGELDQLAGQLSQLEERLAERKGDDQIEKELAQAEAAADELAALLEEMEETAATHRLAQTTAREQLRGHRQQLQAAQSAADNQAKKVNELQKGIARLETRGEMLDQMRTGDLTIPDDVNLLGRLAGLLEIPDEYQTALSAALADRLQTLLLAREADLWRLVTREQSFVALVPDHLPAPAALPEPDHPGLIGPASELIQYDPAYARPVRYLLENIFLVRTPQAAVEIGRTLKGGGLAVALDGLVVYAGGLVRQRLEDPQANILARERAWRETNAALAERQEEVTAAAAAAAEKEKKVAAASAAIATSEEADRAAEATVRESVARVNRAQRDLAQAQQQVRFWQKQGEKQAAEIANLQSRVENLGTKIETGREELVRMSARLAAADEALADLPEAEAQQERQRWQQKIEAAGTIVSGRRAVVDSRRATLEQLAQQQRRLTTRKQEVSRQFEALSLSDDLAQEKGLLAELATIEAELKPLRARQADLQQSLQQLEKQLAAAQKEAHDAENYFTQARLATSQHENATDNLRERIRADLGLVALMETDEQGSQSPLPIAGVVEKLPVVQELPEDIDENIQNYRGQLQRMGGINPDAPTEYEETQERHDFLEQQIVDLQQTEAQLRGVIAELDDLTSRAFAKTVVQVNKVFGKTFTRLFGGGTAELVLTDPDDLTITGVDILAQLPRRRQQGLGLLSGGERSLTAAALIFSLLKVSPTPFCVMDEVDAMLDEANVNRFRDLLIELSQQTQFIVITHNRGTVQAARAVYGVSMGNDSASEVYSIKPEEYIRAV